MLKSPKQTTPPAQPVGAAHFIDVRVPRVLWEQDPQILYRYDLCAKGTSFTFSYIQTYIFMEGGSIVLYLVG